LKTVLFLATTTGYQTRMFGEAADRLGVRLLYATDRCDRLDDPWADGAIPVRFHQEATTVEAIVEAAEAAHINGILAVGDRPTVAAAYAAQLLGLPGNSPDAAKAARDKRLTRERLRAAGLPTPAQVIVASRYGRPDHHLPRIQFPVVVKPLVLSGSRGVIRADTPAQLVTAWDRVSRLLEASDVRELRDTAADEIVIESYIPGLEYAVEGVLEHGRFHTLAVFEKPDPLEGPYFEETIYLTPARADEQRQASIRAAVAAAATALGLRHGPVHAECRVNGQDVFVLEVAARPIGGLCARALRFDGRRGERAGLEELLLRHVMGESMISWSRVAEASGVMMIPIPAGGIYRGVNGVADAMQVPCIWDIRVTAKVDQQLVPLPEGASYLGFIFARGERPDDVEAALREAHARLRFKIDRALPLVER
jgi:phosphoribosylaminoimidazole carboxylase (NCAIR synthetase)